MQFQVEWQVFKYNGFDDLESIEDGQVLTVDAQTVEIAIGQAKRQAYDHAQAMKREIGTLNEFSSEVVRLIGEDGTVHEVSPRHRWVDYNQTEIVE